MESSIFGSNPDLDKTESPQLNELSGIFSSHLKGEVDNEAVKTRDEIVTETNETKLQESPSFERLIYGYLQKKGFQETLQKLEAESRDLGNSFAPLSEPGTSLLNKDASVIEYLLDSDKVFEPKAYFEGYTNLRSWIDESLEIYKSELFSFLFPLFVHSYLDLVSKGYVAKGQEFYAQFCADHFEFHNEDVLSLSLIQAPELVKENSFAQLFRNNKYGLKISNVGFELFISYLQDNQLLTILRLINDHFAIQVISGIPGTGELSHPVVGITGHDTSQVVSFNKTPVYLGNPQLTGVAKTELEQLLKEEDASRKRKLTKPETVTLTSLLEQYRKYTAAKTAGGFDRNEIPLPPTRGADVLRTIQEIKDISKQVELVNNGSSNASICFYTFHNTFGSLNTISMSDDLSFVAGGFSDSYIKLWSLKGENLRSFRPTLNPTMVNEESDLNRMRERHGSSSKRLVGHSGPVYGLSFSNDSKYLLSCSSDATVRLWNTDSFLNLVCYKGHNYPIWDVDFSPIGVYFASASHDRTARLWSCDHISPLRIFAGHLSDVDCVKFHPNGRYIATGSSDKSARLWDIQSGNCVRVFTGHKGPIAKLAVSPDGRCLATAGQNGSIMLWDLASGNPIQSLSSSDTSNSNSNSIHSLVFSSDSKMLISGGADNCVKIWDLSKVDSTVTLASNNQSLKSPELAAKYHTKSTSVVYLKCTQRNLILGAGCFLP